MLVADRDTIKTCLLHTAAQVLVWIIPPYINTFHKQVTGDTQPLDKKKLSTITVRSTD